MYRRKILKSLPVISTLSVSGCIETMPDYSEIPERYSITLKPVHSPAVVAKMREQEANVIPSPLILNLISALLDGNDVIREARNFKLFKDTFHEKLFHYLEAESYYRINKKTIKTGSVTGPKYEISRSGVKPDASEEDTLPFSDLPSHDQWLLHSVLQLSDTGGVIPFSDTFVAGYLDSGYQKESLLVNGIDETFVKFNDRYIKLEEDGRSSTSRERIRYSAKLVAKDLISFSEYIAERYAIKMADLGPDVQELIKKAEKNGGSLTIREGDENFESQEQAFQQLQSQTAENGAVNAITDYEYSTNKIFLNYNGRAYLLYLDGDGH